MNNVVLTEDSEYEAKVSAYLWNRLYERTQRFIIPSKGDVPPTLEQLSYSLLNDLN